MNTSRREIEVLLSEDRTFEPSEEFRAQANVNDNTPYEAAQEDRLAYWAEWAEQLHWFEKWDTVLDWKPPFARWFTGGKLNAAYNCLDRHLDGPTAQKRALVWEG